MVSHIHLLLVWSKHLEASAVTAQVVHGAEDRVVSYYLCLHGDMFVQWCQKIKKSCDTHYTPSWTSVPSHQPHPENTWVTLRFTNHNNAPTNCLSHYCLWSNNDMLHLPLQYWCFPSCHSHRGEQSRQAGEQVQPWFVLTAKSWLPAWFSFNLTVLEENVTEQFAAESVLVVILICGRLYIYTWGWLHDVTT